MSQRSSLRRIPVTVAPRLSKAFGHVVSLTGVMLLPPLLVANLSVWLGCQHLTRSACIALLSTGVALPGQ